MVGSDQSISAEDRLQILDLLGRYFFAIDTGNQAGVIDCFQRDGAVVYGATSEIFQGPDGLRAFAAKVAGNSDTTSRMHLNFPLFFERDDTAVVVSSYLSAAQWSPPEPPSAFSTLRFVQDRCVKTAEGWRIASRSIYPWSAQIAAKFRGR